MASRKNPVRGPDFLILFVAIVAFIVSIISTAAPGFIISLSQLLDLQLHENYVKVIGILTGAVSFFGLLYEIFVFLKFIKSGFDETVNEVNQKYNELDRQYNIISNAITSTKSQSEHLSVVAPAGKWLQTSSWSEIVKKMGDMLQVHRWGEIPSLSELNYLIEFDGNVDLNSLVLSREISASSQFVTVNYLQWHSFEWEGNTYRRASLSSIMSQLFSIYVVMPYEDFAAVGKQISPNGECVPVYPVNRKMIERWIKLRSTDDRAEDSPRNIAQCVKELRKIKWLSSCRDELLQTLNADTKGVFREVAGKDLQDNKDTAYISDKVLGKPTFSVKFFFSDKGEFGVCKVRYVSLFDHKSGEALDNVKDVLGQHLSASVIEEMFSKHERRIIGCYVPVPSDLAALKRKCTQFQNTTYWKDLKITILYSWSYLHVRRITSSDTHYINDTWSFLVSSVGKLTKAVFRGKNKISFQDENAVLPYTMASSESLPKMNGNSEVVFEPGSLETSPSDAFHISWDFEETDPELERLREENDCLRKKIERLENEDTPAKATVASLPTSKRASA